jgi:hypothetical protein
MREVQLSTYENGIHSFIHKKMETKLHKQKRLNEQTIKQPSGLMQTALYIHDTKYKHTH